MEVRRTYSAGAKSSKRIWITVAALLAVVALGVAAAFLAKGLTAGAPASNRTVSTGVTATQLHSGPILIDRNAEQSVDASSGAPAGQHIRFRPGSLQP
ncbi:MAG: hypothetical protein ACHQQS_18585 [Thermoanaerobaculales bacterium]